MSTSILDDLCERLQLTEVGRLAGPRADRAATDQQPYTAYLADLLQAEVDVRQQRYVASRVQMCIWSIGNPHFGQKKSPGHLGN